MKKLIKYTASIAWVLQTLLAPASYGMMTVEDFTQTDETSFGNAQTASVQCRKLEPDFLLIGVTPGFQSDSPIISLEDELNRSPHPKKIMVQGGVDCWNLLIRRGVIYHVESLNIDRYPYDTHIDPLAGTALRELNDILAGQHLPLQHLGLFNSKLSMAELDTLRQVIGNSANLRSLYLWESLPETEMSLDNWGSFLDVIASSSITEIELQGLLLTPELMQLIIDRLQGKITFLSLRDSSLVRDERWASFDWNDLFQKGYKELSMRLDADDAILDNLAIAARAANSVDGLAMHIKKRQPLQALLENHPSLQVYTIPVMDGNAFEEEFGSLANPGIIPGWIGTTINHGLRKNKLYESIGVVFKRINP